MLHAHFIIELFPKVTGDVIRASKSVKLKHPRVLTHGTVLDELIHDFMCETKDIKQAAILNEIRYICQN